MPSWGWHWRTDLNAARKRAQESGQIWGFEVYVVQSGRAAPRMHPLGKISIGNSYPSEAALLRAMKRERFGFFGSDKATFIAVINGRITRTDTHVEAYNLLMEKLPLSPGTYK